VEKKVGKRKGGWGKLLKKTGTNLEVDAPVSTSKWTKKRGVKGGRKKRRGECGGRGEGESGDFHALEETRSGCQKPRRDLWGGNVVPVGRETEQKM